MPLVFLVFIMIAIIAGVGGAGLLRVFLQRGAADLGPPRDDRLLHDVREELESFSNRLSRLEDEMQFFHELRAPKDPPSLEAGPSGSPAAGAAEASARGSTHASPNEPGEPPQ